MGDSAYSFSLTTFSRTGKLLPIEYALNAVANGRTALGICTATGVVLATDKKLPSPVLVDASAVHKIETINETTGFCFAGVGPDYRVLGELCECECKRGFYYSASIYLGALLRRFQENERNKKRTK